MTGQHTKQIRRGLTAPPSRRQIIFGTATIAAAASMIQIQLHEWAHGVVALALVGEATVHGAMVEHPGPASAEAAIAIAGPVFSLILGILVYALSRPVRQGVVRTFLTWASLAALQGTFGYLMVAAVMPVGDTAVAFEAWGVPVIGYVLTGLIGLAGMFLNAYLLSREITRSFSDPGDVLAASVLTWLVATGALIVVYTTVAILADLQGELLVATVLGPVTSLVFAPMATFFWTRTPHLSMPYRISMGPAAILFAAAVVVVLIHAAFPVHVGG